MRKYICMMSVMVIVVIYSAIAQQSPGAPPYMRPGGGVVGKMAELEQSVTALQEAVAALTQHCADLNDYCLDDGYQRKRDMEDTITLYQRLLDEGRMTVVTKPDGTPLLITDWIPTISAASVDLDEDITTLEAH